MKSLELSKFEHDKKAFCMFFITEFQKICFVMLIFTFYNLSWNISEILCNHIQLITLCFSIFFRNLGVNINGTLVFYPSKLKITSEHLREKKRKREKNKDFDF